MKRTRCARPRRSLAPVLLLGTLAAGACGRHEEVALVLWQEGLPTSSPAAQGFQVPPPPFTAGVFPCTDCHDPEIPVNTRRRDLVTAHTEIRLQHDEEHRWCLDCHDAGNRDMLHLAGGELVLEYGCKKSLELERGGLVVERRVTDAHALWPLDETADIGKAVCPCPGSARGRPSAHKGAPPLGSPAYSVNVRLRLPISKEAT